MKSATEKIDPSPKQRISLRDPTLSLRPQMQSRNKNPLDNQSRQARSLISEREDTILDKNSVFHAIFDGKKLKPKQMFSSIRFYTPSGYPREEPHLSYNVAKYNTAIRMLSLHIFCIILLKQNETFCISSLDQYIFQFLLVVSILFH